LLSLRWKLGSALLLVVLVSVGIMAYLTNRNTSEQFQQYVQGGNSAYLAQVADNLEQYYLQQKNWNGVQQILNASLRGNSSRLALADSSGKVIADTGNQTTGKHEISLETSSGTPILADGQQVGTLYMAFPGSGSGKGNQVGRGTASVTETPAPVSGQNSEDNFLNRINSYLWIAGLIAAAAALLLGIFLTRQITRPLRELNTGAKHITRGELSYRVKVRSRDEVGQLADSFNEMAVKLDDNEQSRRRMVSDIAHELRTPLTIIRGTVDGIEDGVFQADKPHLDSIKEQTDLLTHLVNDLRDLSLAESGQLKLDRQPADMAALAQRKIDQFQVNAIQKNIRLSLEAPAGLPEAKVDAKRMEQALGNLLSNAIRHTPEGGQINVALRLGDDGLKSGKSRLIISVADTGEGISAEHLPHIFERFYRVETSRARSEGGAGLGLAIVKQMVQAHGGEVRVESQTGKGSTFYISLPVLLF
jgi:signal transduction histidine kinase